MQVEVDVMRVLSSAETQGDALMLVGQIDRDLYVRTNKVLEAIGGKWNRKRKAHIFEQDAFELIEPILLTGTFSRVKQDFGQFDTPSIIAEQIVVVAEIERGTHVLEPSAGIGRIVAAAQSVGADVRAYEIDQKRFERLRAEHFANGGCFCADFLMIAAYPVFDCVVMNPPFGKQADIDHVTHAWKFVKPGGVLVAIMSAGVEFSQTKRAVAFREMVEANGGTFVDLPPGSFKESGTMVNTVMLTMRRRVA